MRWTIRPEAQATVKDLQAALAAIELALEILLWAWLMHTLGHTNQELQMLALVKLLPEAVRLKVLFRLGLSTIPMVRYVRPTLVEYTPERMVVRIDVSRGSKNGFKSLFLGALAAGGDCVAGAFCM